MGRRLSRSNVDVPPPTMNRRSWLFITGLILWLAMVFAYAGGGAAMVVYRIIMDGGVLLLWLLAGFGIGDWLLPLFGATEKSDGLLLRFATGTALGLGAMSLAVLGLGLVGYLSQATAIALVALGDLLAIARLARDRNRAAEIRYWFQQPAGWGWLGLLAVPLAAVMTIGAMLPPYLLWTPEEPHGYDVVEYHLQVPREWYEAGRIFPLHHNVFSFFPFNVEMHYLLAMHLRGGPWAGMYLSQFMHGAFIVLTVLAVCALARNGRMSGVVALVAMATTPWLAQLGAIAYDEGGFLLFGTLAIGWAMRGLRETDRRIGRFALAGVMAGLACGVKLTAAPEVMVAIFVVSALFLLLLRPFRQQPLARRVLALFVFGLAGTLTFAPWLIRTWAWSGNPVFPELPALGHGDFSPVQVERWKRAHAAQPWQSSVVGRLQAGWSQILADWQFGFLLIPAALVAIARDYRNPQVWFLGAMLFLLAVFWLGFTHLQGRFFILAVPICGLLVAQLGWEAIPIFILQAVLGIVLLNLHFLTPNRMKLLSSVLGTEDLSWIPSGLDAVPKDAPLVLVGDAKAFLYQRPMSLLSYRTIFDADTSNGRGVIEAWAGPPPKSGTQWLLIDPGELERFEKYYPPFPQIPQEIAAHRERYAMQR